MKYAILAIIPFLLTAAMAVPSTEAPVKFAWDISAEENIAGYRLHYGLESGVYTEIVDLGMVPTGPEGDPQAHLTGPIPFPFGTYFLAVTAYNTYGLESDYSNEISFTTKSPPSPPSRFHMVVTVETSDNLKDWEPIAQMLQPRKAQQFFRLRMEEQ